MYQSLFPLTFIEKDTAIFIKNCDPSASGHLDIPASINDKPVTTILESAFCGCISLTSIVIPDSVTTIEKSAFQYCFSLKSISIPDSATTIEGNVFYVCAKLQNIRVDASNPNYSNDKQGAFCDKKLTTIIAVPNALIGSFTIPESVSIIEFQAFSGCQHLTSITIPDSVTTIKGSVFSGCASLTTISIPGSVTTIEGNLFYISSNLKTIHVDSGNPNYSSDTQGALYDKSFTSIIVVPSAIKGKFTIPDSVTAIEEYAFAGCSSLTTITIPDSVKTIKKWALPNSKDLNGLSIPSSVTRIE